MSKQNNKEITFENFCDKYKIIYSVKPYTFVKFLFIFLLKNRDFKSPKV